MFADSISFGIDNDTGRPYVLSCRGRYVFDATDDAAAFVAARVTARLDAYQGIWTSFARDLARHGGERGETLESVPF